MTSVYWNRKLHSEKNPCKGNVRVGHITPDTIYPVQLIYWLALQHSQNAGLRSSDLQFELSAANVRNVTMTYVNPAVWMDVLGKKNLICCQGTFPRHVQSEKCCDSADLSCLSMSFLCLPWLARNKTHSLPARGNSVGAASAFYFACSTVSDQRLFGKRAAAADTFSHRWEVVWLSLRVHLYPRGFIAGTFKEVLGEMLIWSFLKDTIPVSIKSLITIWPMTLDLSGSRGGLSRCPAERSIIINAVWNHITSSSVLCLPFLSLSLSLLLSFLPSPQLLAAQPEDEERKTGWFLKRGGGGGGGGLQGFCSVSWNLLTPLASAQRLGGRGGGGGGGGG